MSAAARTKAARHSASLRWTPPIAWMFVLSAFIFACGMLAIALHPDLAYGTTRAQVKALTTAQVKAIIRDEAKRAGLGRADIDALLAICRPESNFHPFSHNSRYECHGLFQLSKGMAHGHKWWGPRWNTRRAIRYIRYSSHHYRTPRRALAFRRIHGWY